MEIINPGKEDYHSHSFNFSDGLATINEMVQMADKIGLKTLAITDHSQDTIDYYQWGRKGNRKIASQWKNTLNDVEIVFGIEGDLLNEQGVICDHIQGDHSDFLILSAHWEVYKVAGDENKITQAHLKAIEEHHKKIKFIGHLDSKNFEQYLDIEKVIKAANQYGIPLEFNCANFVNGKTSMGNLNTMLHLADRIYVNSDAHTLNELRDLRQEGLKYLRDNNFL